VFANRNTVIVSYRWLMREAALELLLNVIHFSVGFGLLYLILLSLKCLSLCCMSAS